MKVIGLNASPMGKGSNTLKLVKTISVRSITKIHSPMIRLVRPDGLDEISRVN